MEHIVQFAIGIDDKAIRRRIEEQSVEQIEQQIKQDVVNKIFSCYGNSNADPKRSPLSEFSKHIMIDVMDEHKDEIINRTAEILADKLCRTKAAKELINSVKEEISDIKRIRRKLLKLQKMIKEAY